jgi:uncharacterized membrane protein YciS (DUF1049 family)
MGSIMLTVLICVPILVGWLALCGPFYLARRLARRRRQRELRTWVRVAPGLSEVDADLDRTWTEEQKRTEQQP